MAKTQKAVDLALASGKEVKVYTNGIGIPLICSSQGIDTGGNNPCGKFQLDVLKAVCEFERNLKKDRVLIGLAAACEKGVRLGRPPRPHQRTGEVLALKKQGMGLRAIGRQLNMPVSTVHAILKPK